MKAKEILAVDTPQAWLETALRELKLLLDRLNLELPAQPPPKITTAQAGVTTSV